ncbi:MAG TPA: urease subunit gamma [Limnochordales bacterium]
MHLSPKEQERVWLFALAELARKRRAKGLKLNYPEALALICDEVMEAAREGCTLEEAVARGCQVLTVDDVMEGVPDLLTRVQVEAVFADGTRLVTLHGPIRPRQDAAGAAGAAMGGAATGGAAAGSQGADGAGAAPAHPLVGEVRVAAEPIVLNAGKPRQALRIRNESPLPIWVGSHFPLEKANPRLQFDREAARGWRLAVPAGEVVLIPPESEMTVEIVPRAPAGATGGRPAALPADAAAAGHGLPAHEAARHEEGEKRL